MKTVSLACWAILAVACTSATVTPPGDGSDAGRSGDTGEAGGAIERGGAAGEAGLSGGAGGGEEGGAGGQANEGGSSGQAGEGGTEPSGGVTIDRGGATAAGGRAQGGAANGGSAGEAVEQGGSAGSGQAGEGGEEVGRGGAVTVGGRSGTGGATAEGGETQGGAGDGGSEALGGAGGEDAGAPGEGGEPGVGGSGEGGSGEGGVPAQGGSGVGGATVVDPCAAEPCLNGGTCTAQGTTYSCECHDGYAGSTCSRLIFQLLPRATGTTGPCAVNAVSGNGNVVVGSCNANTDAGSQSIAYRAKNGAATTLPGTMATGSAGANDTDENGIVVVGWTDTASGRRMATWNGTALDDLHGFVENMSASRGVAISGDGRYVVGDYTINFDPTDEYSTQDHVVRWDLTGYSDPEVVFSGVIYLWANGLAIDETGSVVVGADDLEPFIWTPSDGVTKLPPLDGASSREATGISANGTVIVGTAGTQAIYWENGNVPVLLGFVGTPRATNRDGSVIVGEAGGAPFIWTEDDGILFLTEELAALEVDLSSWTLTTVTDISWDGTVLVGEGTYDGVTRGWMVDLSDTGIAGF